MGVSSHPNLQDDGVDVLVRAIKQAQQSLTRPSGTIVTRNQDGSKTVVGPGAGAAGVAQWVGDTTAPGVPTGITATSKQGIVYITWDGTLDGGIPEDFGQVNLLVDGAPVGRLLRAGTLPVDGLTAGATVQVTATAQDLARAQDGTLAPNVSAACAPVPVTVESAVSQADLDAAQAQIDQAKTDITAAQDTANSALTTATSANSTATAAANAAASAAGIADGKADVLIQPDVPGSDMQKDTTLWIDTAARTYAWAGDEDTSTSTESADGEVMRTNLLKDPQFENSSYWSRLRVDQDGGTITVNTVGYFPRIYSNDTTNKIPIAPGDKYACAVEVVGDESVTHRLGLQFHRSNGGNINSPGDGRDDGSTITQGTSGRLVLQGTAPDESAYVTVMLGLPNKSPVGMVASFSEPIFEIADTVGTYFDGDTADTAANTPKRWNGGEWEAVTDGTATSAAAAAAAAQTTASDAATAASTAQTTAATANTNAQQASAAAADAKPLIQADEPTSDEQVQDRLWIDLSARTHAWTGEANASTSTESVDGTVVRTNLASNQNGSTDNKASKNEGGGVGVLSVVSSGGPSNGPDTFLRNTCTSTQNSGNFGIIISPDPSAGTQIMTPGKTYAFSAWIRDSSGPDTDDIVLQLRTYTSSGRHVGYRNLTTTTTADGDWTLFQGTYTAADTEEQCYIRPLTVTSVDHAAGDTFDATGFLMEEASTVGTYFDGDTPSTPANTPKRWDGSQWSPVTDGTAVQAAAAAAAAQTTADGKNKVLTQTAEPSHTGLVPGDLWRVLTVMGDGSRRVTGQQVWNGTAFVPDLLVADSILVPGSAGTVSIADGAITTPKLLAGQIDGNTVLATNSVTAPKISATVEMLTKLLSARKINADEIDVGSLAAAIVTSTDFHTSNGLLGFDATNGFWAKNSSGAYIFQVPVDASGVLMVGGLKTALTGNRVEVTETGSGSSSYGSVNFYGTSDSSEHPAGIQGAYSDEGDSTTSILTTGAGMPPDIPPGTVGLISPGVLPIAAISLMRGWYTEGGSSFAKSIARIDTDAIDMPAVVRVGQRVYFVAITKSDLDAMAASPRFTQYVTASESSLANLHGVVGDEEYIYSGNGWVRANCTARGYLSSTHGMGTDAGTLPLSAIWGDWGLSLTSDGGIRVSIGGVYTIAASGQFSGLADGAYRNFAPTTSSSSYTVGNIGQTIANGAWWVAITFPTVTQRLSAGDTVYLRSDGSSGAVAQPAGTNLFITRIGS